MSIHLWIVNVNQVCSMVQSRYQTLYVWLNCPSRSNLIVYKLHNLHTCDTYVTLQGQKPLDFIVFRQFQAHNFKNPVEIGDLLLRLKWDWCNSKVEMASLSRRGVRPSSPYLLITSLMVSSTVDPNFTIVRTGPGLPSTVTLTTTLASFLYPCQDHCQN